MNWAKTAGRLLAAVLAVTMLFAVVLRPPGAMISIEDETVTYVICTGHGLEAVEVPAGGDPSDNTDPGCRFFAAQIAALLDWAPDVALVGHELERQAKLPQSTFSAPLLVRPPYDTRGPPSAS